MRRPLRALAAATLAAVAGGLCVACSGRGTEGGDAPDPGFVECVVPRPEVCTRDWRPVCALRDTGIRCVTTPCDAWERKTFANACTACADAAVYGWRPGECPAEGPAPDAAPGVP